MNDRAPSTADAITIDTNPHSNLPPASDILTEISAPAEPNTDITDPERPLPFGVYRAPVVGSA